MSLGGHQGQEVFLALKAEGVPVDFVTKINGEKLGSLVASIVGGKPVRASSGLNYVRDQSVYAAGHWPVLKNSVDPTLPISRPSVQMSDGHDQNPLYILAVNHAIREPAQTTAPGVA